MRETDHAIYAFTVHQTESTSLLMKHRGQSITGLDFLSDLPSIGMKNDLSLIIHDVSIIFLVAIFGCQHFTDQILALQINRTSDKAQVLPLGIEDRFRNNHDQFFG